MLNTPDDWQWQVRNSIKTINELEEYIKLTDDDKKEIEEAQAEYSWGITPYYARLMDKEDPKCPIRLQALPQSAELHDQVGVIDPLQEENHCPVHNIIRVYPDRIAWCVSNRCAVLCRHCLRKRMVGRENFNFSKDARKRAFDWIRQTPEIRDVLLTGGDPLMYPDDFLEEFLSELRSIDHVEIIRIGSRTLCTMPQRITEDLCAMLKKYHPLWINTQFNHPKEITEEAAKACNMLADAGIPLGNQSVLLKGINDDIETMKELVRGLVKIRVRPYYIYQCQILAGTEHFRTPVEVGMNIIKNLRGYTTGFAVPTFVLDTPYGKVPMSPNYIVERTEEYVALENFEGKVWREPNKRPESESLRSLIKL